VFGYDKTKGKFFEVHGGHCSCHGLEGQWDEEYFDDVKQMVAVFEKRFAAKHANSYYREASSSVEFQNWLLG